jgi:hypothetical protein
LYLISSAAGEDVCGKEGIVVKNLTTVDLWYKRDEDNCFKWKQNKIFSIRPDESVQLFSDLTCETSYCGYHPNYDSFRSTDKDKNCRVRILPSCSLSDM